MILDNISDTARWVAVYRAMETERPDALFKDPYARKLAGNRGEQIVKAMRRGRSSAWAMIVRTAVMDEIIMQTISRGDVDVVLNLAAGLDARPWRMPLPASLRWIDVDFAGILEYKSRIIADALPACKYEAVHLDLTNAQLRRDLFTRTAAQSTNVLVISEGLLIYLSPDEVGNLATDLAAAENFRWWLTDLASPRLLRMMRSSWGKAANAADAPFQFAPAEGTRFFEKYGWKELISRPTLREARRLGREMPMVGFWRALMRLFPARTRKDMENMASVVLLERA